jgi:hypothetical protein
MEPDTFSVIVTLLTVSFFYFLPAVIAYANKRRQREAITVLNLLLGWTVIGWIVALVWSLCEDK